MSPALVLGVHTSGLCTPQVLCIALLLLLLGTFNLSAQFFSLGLAVFHALRDSNTEHVSAAPVGCVQYVTPALTLCTVLPLLDSRYHVRHATACRRHWSCDHQLCPGVELSLCAHPRSGSASRALGRESWAATIMAEGVDSPHKAHSRVHVRSSCCRVDLVLVSTLVVGSCHHMARLAKELRYDGCTWPHACFVLVCVVLFGWYKGGRHSLGVVLRSM